MTFLLIPLAVLADEALRYVLHHRTGLITGLAACSGWTWHHVRRTVRNPGHRVAGRDTPKPREAVTA